MTPWHRLSRVTPNVSRSRSMNAKTSAFVRNRTVLIEGGGSAVGSAYALLGSPTPYSRAPYILPERALVHSLSGRTFQTPPWALRIDHELQEIAIWVADVNAGTGLPSTALATHRTLDDVCAGAIEHRLERSGCPFPDNAQIPARRLGGCRSQSERRILPACGTMKVDHLVTDAHRNGVRGFDHLKPKRPIECQHRLGVLHRERHMIEPTNASALLCQRPRSPRSGSRGYNRLHETTPRRGFGHGGILDLPVVDEVVCWLRYFSRTRVSDAHE